MLDIDTIATEYSKWRSVIKEGKDVRHGIVFGFRYDERGFRIWAEGLISSFERGNYSDKVQIRDLISDFDMLWLFMGLPLRAANESDGKMEIRSLKVALWTFVLIDYRVEGRELDHAMRKIINAARKNNLPIAGVMERVKKDALSPVTADWFQKWVDAIAL